MNQASMLYRSYTNKTTEPLAPEPYDILEGTNILSLEDIQNQYENNPDWYGGGTDEADDYYSNTDDGIIGGNEKQNTKKQVSINCMTVCWILSDNDSDDEDNDDEDNATNSSEVNNDVGSTIPSLFKTGGSIEEIQSRNTRDKLPSTEPPLIEKWIIN